MTCKFWNLFLQQNFKPVNTKWGNKRSHHSEEKGILWKWMKAAENIRGATYISDAFFGRVWPIQNLSRAGLSKLAMVTNMQTYLMWISSFQNQYEMSKTSIYSCIQELVLLLLNPVYTMKQVLVPGNNPYMAQNNQLLLTIMMMIMLEVKLIMI